MFIIATANEKFHLTAGKFVPVSNVTMMNVSMNCVLMYVHYICMHIRGSIQNISEWCLHLYSSCGSAKHCSKPAEHWIPGSTATFAVTAWKPAKTSSRNLARTYLAASPWQCSFPLFRPHPALSGETIWLSFPTHGTPIIWDPVTCSCFQKWNWSWKDAGFIPLKRSRPNGRECLALWQ
jgi:hypothetical protein